VLLLLFLGYATRRALQILVPADNRVLVETSADGLLLAVCLLGSASLVLLLACSTGVFTRPSRMLLCSLLVVWLASFTWYGWFSPDSPFRMHEMVGIDLANGRRVALVQRNHIWAAFTIYLVLSGLTAAPWLILSLRYRIQSALADVGRRIVRPLTLSSVVLFLIGAAWSIVSPGIAIPLTLVVAGVACSALAATYGSRFGFVLALLEVVVPSVTSAIIGR
jgi:hypothetical protein